MAITSSTYRALSWVFEQDRMHTCHLLSVPRRMFPYHMEEITVKPRYIYRNCPILVMTQVNERDLLQIVEEPTFIFLPPCLATKLAPKTITEPKSRGTSSGTKLWRRVQRYSAKFLAFIQIKGLGCFLEAQAQIAFNNFCCSYN